MNRIIKFRAWDKKTQKMSKPFEIKQMFDDNFKIFESQETVWLDNIIFIQSTGLYDKNGVEIYEGDVVKIIDGIQEEYIRVIEYKDGGYTVDIWEDFAPLISNYSLEVEIIGNIYENPRLLK